MNGITNKKGTAMKKLIMTIVGAIALGASAEHVNLWPLYYDDGGSKSIAWPLIEYGDSTDWRFGLVFREYDSWGVFPFFFDFSNSIVVTPVVVSKDLSGGAIFPILFADFKGSDTFWTLFPAIYRHDWGYDNATTWAAAGLVGHTVRRGETDAHWLAPLYWAKPRERFCVLAGGLAGWDHEREDKFMDWALPFYWRDEDSFWSIPWACGYGEDGKVESWFSLPLLSWCRGDELHITPIAGKTDDSSWIAPLYYWNAHGTFCTLFGGWTKDSSWLLPLFYRDADSFLSLPYGRMDRRDGSVRKWWGLPLIQTISGKSEGFGVWPIFERERSVDLDDFEAAIDAERLTDAVSATVCIKSNEYSRSSCESLEWLGGLAGSEHRISVRRKKWPMCEIDESRSFGNILTFKRTSHRAVTFDQLSGKREKETAYGRSHLLGFVWNSSWRTENSELKKAESSVLWRVWHYEFEDGDSTLDVFPWFTREKTKDGRTSTSFLWRFYRCETDPVKGTTLDLFFIPVLR